MPLLPARLNTKPHYVFHPVRMLRRARRGTFGDPKAPNQIAQLPWGLPIEVAPSDAIGYSILNAGVFDPALSEAIHRLVAPDDLVVDAGANVGYVTSLAAARSGPGGTVIGFEPHPDVFRLLSANVARWRERPGLATIEVHEMALSDYAGVGELSNGPLFRGNMGLSALRKPEAGASGAGTTFAVKVSRLDAVIGDRRVDVLKIDVEGHEPEVLRGAVGLLKTGRVRDLIFEDHEVYPSEATTLVEEVGYRLLSIDNDLFGLRLGSPASRGKLAAWPGPSYLATREPDRALKLLRSRYWQIAGIGPSLPFRRGPMP